MPACDITANVISVDITPEEVVPLLDSCLPDIREALHRGIDYANDTQPDPGDRDPWFWSHSARFEARRALERSANGAHDWELIAGVPNCGIHVGLGGLHVVRVLRSLAGTTPAPGGNQSRQQAWQQSRLQFPIYDDTGGPHHGAARGLPPLDLVLDWTTDDNATLVMHLGMPQGVWGLGEDPILAWRVLLPSADSLEGLAFPSSTDADVPVRLRVDEAEQEAM